MASPTETAQHKFRDALRFLKQEPGAIGNIAPLVNNNLLQGLISMNEGLVALSTGLRATYMLLEEVKKSQQQSGGAQQRPNVW